MTTKTELNLEQRHTRLVAAVHEAIETLRAPFAANDEIPGTIVDAIDILEAGLKRR